MTEEKMSLAEMWERYRPVREVAEAAGITPQAIYQLCHKGKIGHIKFGPHYYIDIAEIRPRPPVGDETVYHDLNELPDDVDRARLVKVSEAAKILGCSRTKILRLGAEGKIPSYKINNLRYVDISGEQLKAQAPEKTQDNVDERTSYD